MIASGVRIGIKVFIFTRELSERSKQNEIA